jgi:hypothetical protein
LLLLLWFILLLLLLLPLLLQWKVDENGANIGILWDNRTRPHQYSKPGEAGLASGLSSM